MSLRLFFGSWSPTFGHRFRYFTSTETALSSTGTRGIFTIPDSIASTRPKSLTTHGKQSAFPVARPGQERRSGGQVVDRFHAELPADGPQPGEPDTGSLGVLPGLRLLISAQRLVGFAVGRIGVAALVAVVSLVVEDHDL